MTAPEARPQPAQMAPQPKPMPNAYRVALVALALFAAALIASFVGLEDSSGAACGSAFNPGPDSLIDSQTTECAFRVSTQQGFAYPLMLVSLAVAAGGFAWRTERS